MNRQAAEGKRILLVEDSPVVSLKTEDMLSDNGFFVVGPAYDMQSALDLARNEQIDAAIVDLNIRGEKSFEVFSRLDERNIPFVVVSGYANWAMPKEWEARPRLSKPVSQDELFETLGQMLEQAD